MLFYCKQIDNRLSAYREGHSTSTAFTQITDWLREIDDKKIVGAVLLDILVWLMALSIIVF
jgi:hypothetical protein